MLMRNLEELQRNVNEKDDYTIRLAAEAAKEFDILTKKLAKMTCIIYYKQRSGSFSSRNGTSCPTRSRF